MKHFKIALLVALFLSINQQAFAFGFGDAITRSNAFFLSVNNFLLDVMNDPGTAGFVRTVFLFFSAVAICFALMKWARNAAELDNLMYQVLMVLIVGAILANYPMIIRSAWMIHDGITEGLQRIAVGNTDAFFLPAFIRDVLKGIYSNGISLWGLFKNNLASAAVFVIITILSILSLLVNLWVLWCFAIAQIVGFFVVPLLLSKRFHFVFDGWLRFLFGFIVYGVIARINLIMVAILVRSMFQLPSYAAPAQAIQLEGDTIGHLIGLMCYLIIAIFALIKTGGFARSIVSGATGFGSALSTGARLAVGKLI